MSYSTALDIFLLMCFTFVFAALVEYAGVNYFTKSGNIENPVDDDDVCIIRSFFLFLLFLILKSLKHREYQGEPPHCNLIDGFFIVDRAVSL